MREIIPDSIPADSIVADTLRAVAELPPRDSNLVADMSHIFGSTAIKGDCVLEVTSQAAHEVVSWPYAVMLPVILCIYVLIFKFYRREIISISKIIVFPALFNTAREVNSVHQRQYLVYAFIFTVAVITLLSWLYVADGDVRVPVAVSLYFLSKIGLPRLLSFRNGRKSPISKVTFFIVAFYTTSFIALAPVAMLSVVFGINEFLYTLIIIILASYYLFLGQFFYKEKFSFKQLLLYLCTAEVIPLALASTLFYTKIITFGN